MHTLAMGLALVVGLSPAAAYAAPHTVELERYQAIVDKAPASNPASVDKRELVAGGVPPSAMPGCGDAQAVGGWDVRDLIATGTSATEPSPVRKRNVRLSEPCFEDVPGTDEALLYVPVRATEIPVPMLDEDDDGRDDGAPEIEPGGEFATGCMPGATRCVTVMGFLERQWRPASAWHSYTYVCLSVVGSLSGHRLMADMPEDRRPAGQYQVESAYGSGYGGQFAAPAGTNVSPAWNTSNSTPVSANCPAGSTHAFNIDIPTGGTGTMPLPAPKPPIRVGIQQIGTTPIYWSEKGDSVELGTDYYGGTQGAQFVVGAGEDMVPSGENTVISCAATYSGPPTVTYEWSSVEKWVSVDGPPKVVDGVATAWSARENVGITDATFTSSDCPFLVSIELWVCAYTDYGSDNFGCTQVTWDAEKYREHGSYGDDETPVEVICRIYPDDPACYDVLNPPYVDGTSWDDTCGANFPELAWGDWNWLPDVVGHLAVCLWVPANGFDRGNWIHTAAQNGALGDVADLAAAGRTSFGFSAGCGVLVQDDQTGLDLNTCNWSSWSGDIRGIIALILWAGFALWAINFLIKMIVGIPNRETPLPTGDSK